jgi:phosphoglycerate dehydrogenase-like enzyme
VADMESIDPRLRVVTVAYEEPRELRVGREGDEPDAYRSQAPVLTDEQLRVLAEAEIVLTHDLPFDVGGLAPKLRWVQAIGSGTEHLKSAGLAAAGIRLTSNAGGSAAGIAEFVVARVLAAWKKLRELDDLQRSRRWDRLFGDQLGGCTAGLIGLGAINSAVAKRLRAFEMEIIACRRTVVAGAPIPDNVDEVFPAHELHRVLARSDVVVAAVPGNDETRGLMSREAFAAMKPGAFFVNVGRGSLVDETALVDALQSGHLRGAALDVTAAEPVEIDDPLWDAPNIALSAHVATVGHALFRNLHRLFLQNLHRYLRNEPLINEQDL